jgi:CelD/BcsL family acetyltransferase involved in cellulose biosynthesis
LTIDYRLVPWPEAIAKHAQEWQALAEESGVNPTLMPEWASVIVDVLASPAQVQVLVGTLGDRLHAIVPFRVRDDRVSGVPVRVLEPLSSVMSYHAEFIARSEHESLVDALLDCGRTHPWDLVRVSGILAECATAKALIACAQRRGWSFVDWAGEASPYLQLGLSSNAILATSDKRKRYLLRKRAKRFGETSHSSLRWYETESDVASLFTAMLSIERASWKHDAGVAISTTERETRYYQRLLPWLARSRALLANVLWIGETPVAYCLCYRWQDAYGCIKASYRTDYAHLSIGHHSQDQLILRIADLGAREFDFLGNDDQDKLTWTDKLRHHRDYFIYSPRGRGRWLGIAQEMRNDLWTNLGAGDFPIR